MLFHEKSLELNITHELLNLADSWYWFLTDIPLWRYWRPRYRLPFLKYPKSTAAGFHITAEGKDDSTGEAGGGYDVRIKTGLGNHLLFIQYKLGEYVNISPDPNSIFQNPPIEHYLFKINSTKTNQHFTLRKLAQDIGAKKNNAVVYALPLIADIKELEEFAGKLIRRTKFISIADIDAQALVNNVTITKGQEHSFRVGYPDMDKCEVNSLFFSFRGQDRTPEILADMISIRFEKILSYFVTEIYKNYKEYKLNAEYIPEGIQRAFGEYIRFLLHYFEVSPDKQNSELYYKYCTRYDENFIDEFSLYKSNSRDVLILTKVFNSLSTFTDFIDKPVHNLSNNDSQEHSKNDEVIFNNIPKYSPSLFANQNSEGFFIHFEQENLIENILNINYLVV